MSKALASCSKCAAYPFQVSIVTAAGAPLLTSDHARRYFEGPWVYHRLGIYYLSWSTGDTHRIVYATAARVDGPYTYRGVLSHPVHGWTHHHSVVEVDDDEWLFFYHDTLRSGLTHLRDTKVVPLHHRADGTIVPIRHHYNNSKPAVLRPRWGRSARTGISQVAGVQGIYCADGDQLLSSSGPKGCKGTWEAATVAPFASGAVDVRSRSFAVHVDRCKALWKREWEGASCDGQQGFFVAHCPPDELSLMHLTTLKVRCCTLGRARGVVDCGGEARPWPPPSAVCVWQMRAWKTMKNTPTVHTTLIHGVKRYNRSIDWRPASPALAPLHYKLRFELEGNRTHGNWAPVHPEMAGLFVSRCMNGTCWNQRVCREHPALCM